MARKFGKKQTAESRIPTSSMADIAFLLLVFFMVTTVLKLEEGLPIDLPKAQAAQDIPRENVVHIWVDRTGKISINDMIVTIPSVEGVIAQRIRANPGIIVAFNTDENAPYGVMSDIMEQLKRASAVRVSFASKKEKMRFR
jgi:biopolymer transport protein ExbD